MTCPEAPAALLARSRSSSAPGERLSPEGLDWLEGASVERILGRMQSENFKVASRLLPRAWRSDLVALYGFARLVDEIGDAAPGDRGALLDWIEADLERAFEGRAQHPLLSNLAPTIARCGLPRAALRRLIRANRQDQRVQRYATWRELREYCRLSADPVGELVLHVFGIASPERIALSDSICTGLQLAEHWQDVAEDLRAGRIYLPGEDLDRFGCSATDLTAPRATGRVRELMRFEVARARRLLREGAPLVHEVRGRARLAIAGFAAGGFAALDAIERRDFDVLGGAPRPRHRDRLRHTAALLRRPRGGAGSP